MLTKKEKERIETFIYSYKTYNKFGFIYEELEEIFKLFTNLNMKKFDLSMRGNTCIATTYKGNSRIVNYHCDVYHALLCGLENRNLTIAEWD
jgi:hypothetical protein